MYCDLKADVEGCRGNKIVKEMIWAGVFKVCGIQRFLTIYLKSYFNANSLMNSIS